MCSVKPFWKILKILNIKLWIFDYLKLDIWFPKAVVSILVHFLVLVQPYGKYYWSQSESSVLIEMVCIHSLIFIFTCPRLCLSLVAPMLNNVSVHDCHGMTLSLVPHLASHCPDVLDSVIAKDGGKTIQFPISKSSTIISSWNSQQGK